MDRFADEPLVDCAHQHQTAILHGVELHWVEAGPPVGRPVILLHGFPEFWWGWRHQIPALAAAGLRVIALDMRGYNRSGKPDRVEAYGIEHLAGDVRALIEHLGYERAWAREGAVKAMINYYRAFVRGARKSMGLLGRRIERPVLVLWGERDRYLGAELAEPPVELVPSCRVVRYPGATHWVQHEMADEVSRELVGFLG